MICRRVVRPIVGGRYGYWSESSRLDVALACVPTMSATALNSNAVAKAHAGHSSACSFSAARTIAVPRT